MSPEEYQAAAAALAEVDTEAAALDRQERDYIEKAREFNDARRATTSRRIALLKSAEPLRNAVQEHQQEVKRQLAAKVKQEAEAREAARAAAVTAEKSQVETLAAENEELKKQLAAKG